jgi:sugar/nucleoside kinase (ribokinase family)|tara:strand:- start:9709 stop:10710 length:1002 start_codon:yes stop_codon:yes gene_type:complete
MKNYAVYAIGNALVDIEYHTSPEKLLELSIEKGVMTLIDEPKQNDLMKQLGDSHESMACGGSAANTIIGLAHFGANVHYDCHVANDTSGQFFARDLYVSKVDSNLKLDDSYSGVTGKCLVFVTPDADRTMNTFLGASIELNSTNVDENAIQNADYVYLEGYLVTSEGTMQAAIKASQLGKRHQKKIAITLSDPNMVTFFRDGMLEMIGEGVDLLFANEEEACGLAQTQDLQEAISFIKGHARTFAITRGKQGAIVFDGKNLIEISGHTVNAIDTLGAGDLFAGAFLFGLSEGMSFQQCGDLASLASSRIVTQYGPRLNASETKAILAEFRAGI